MSYLSIQSLYFKYMKKFILKDISLNIKKGSFVALLGPNGSGKSTLLKNILLILNPFSGTISIDGYNIKNLSYLERSKIISYVPQQYNIDYSFTVEQTVLMGRIPYQSRFQSNSYEDINIVNNSMKQTNVFHLKDKYITELSGGELQRVFIARAIAQNTDILLLDEPIAHLDLQHQLHLLNLLKIININENKTIILILHDLNLAAQFCDQIILMKEGKIYYHGKPENVLTSKNIKFIYNIKSIIEKNIITKKLNIIPIEKKESISNNNIILKVHLICSGGNGLEILKYLNIISDQYKKLEVTCGILNKGDSDWYFAKKIGLKIIENEPYSIISNNKLKMNMEYIMKSDIIILSNIYLNKSNIEILKQIIFSLLNLKKKVIVLEIDINKYINILYEEKKDIIYNYNNLINNKNLIIIKNICDISKWLNY